MNGDKFCRNCGKQISVDFKFCPHCGTKNNNKIASEGGWLEGVENGLCLYIFLEVDKLKIKKEKIK